MKMLNTRCGVLVLMLTLGGLTGSTLAAPVSDNPGAQGAPAFPHRGHHFRGGGPWGSPLLGTLLRATRQLNLSSDQQTQIKNILSSARTAERSAANQVDISVLGNPADPNYGSALQAAKTAAANRIQRESELQSQVYNVLTTEQRTQLPAVLAGMKARAAAFRAQHSAVAPR